MIHTKIPASHFADVVGMIEINQQIAMNHTACSAGQDTKQRLYVKRVPDGYIAYCHNCGGTGFKFFRSDVRAAGEVMAGMKTAFGDSEDPRAEEATFHPTETIADLELIDEIPIRERVWLYQYYMTDDDIKKFGIKYSLTYQMIALPITYGAGVSVPAGYQLRNLGAAYKWKYKTIAYETSKRRFNWGPWATGPKGYAVGDTLPLVLTEDLLSSYRVAAAAPVCAMALMGTHADTRMIEYLRETANEKAGVLIWLDDDIAGVSAAVEIRKQIGASTEKVTVIRETQPKNLSPEKIEAVIDNALKSF